MNDFSPAVCNCAKTKYSQNSRGHLITSACVVSCAALPARRFVWSWSTRTRRGFGWPGLEGVSCPTLDAASSQRVWAVWSWLVGEGCLDVGHWLLAPSIQPQRSNARYQHVTRPAARAKVRNLGRCGLRGTGWSRLLFLYIPYINENYRRTIVYGEN